VEQRLNRLREGMSARGLEAFLVMRPENRRYLSGFTGSAGYVLVTRDEAILFTDFRYRTQAPEQSPHCRFVEIQNALPIDAILAELTNKQLKNIGFEKDYVNYAQYEQFVGGFTGIEVVPSSGLVEDLRAVKDEGELAIMRQAAKIADDAFSHILGYLRPGISELDVSLELETFMKKQGAHSAAFEIIVASGKRSALPHGKASAKILEKGDFVKLDFGAYYQGYNSDLTRTVVLGQPTDKQREIYNIVLESQLHALANIKPGMTGKEADALSRDIITAKGYGEFFGHSLGHGLGMVVHELPNLSVRAESQVLRPGHVVTVEPGIYLPELGGVRIEDDIVITENGNEVLTHSTKELLIIE